MTAKNDPLVVALTVPFKNARRYYQGQDKHHTVLYNVT